MVTSRANEKKSRSFEHSLFEYRPVKLTFVFSVSSKLPDIVWKFNRIYASVDLSTRVGSSFFLVLFMLKYKLKIYSSMNFLP